MSKDDPAAGVDEQKAIQEAPEVADQDSQDEQAAATEFSQSVQNELSMKVKVYSPFKNYYDGQAFSLTAENATGPFDILPKHHNFISLLTPCELVIRTVTQGEQRVRISGGLVHIKNDSTIVFLDV